MTMNTKCLEFRWTVSRGRDTYGWNIVSLYVESKKVGSTCGGGYDMMAYADRLLRLQPAETHYGLSYHDPNFDPGKAVIGRDCADRTFSGKSHGKTVEQAEKDGNTAGLERYQSFYRDSSKDPTPRHTIPLINGACGFSSVQSIMAAIGLNLKSVSVSRDIYVLEDYQK